MLRIAGGAADSIPPRAGKPIIVRPLAPEGGAEIRYKIVRGALDGRQSRTRSSASSGHAIVRRSVALIENMQREDLNPLEEAGALKRLVNEFEMTHAEAADAVGRSRAAVTNLMRLLELPDEVKEMVEGRSLNMGHARALLALEDPEALVALARRAAQQRLERA